MGVDKSNVNTSLEPAGLQDSPMQRPISSPITQHSINRNLTEEDVGGISPAGGGTFLIRVSGYDGATPTGPTRCVSASPIRSGSRCAPPARFPLRRLGPPPTTFPAGTNTLFLVNRQRSRSDLRRERGGPGHDGAREHPDERPRRQRRRRAGRDATPRSPRRTRPGICNPCSAARANAVAAAIAAKIDAFKAATPSVKNVVLIGGFDQIPAFAVPDLTRIANETGYASTFANNQYYGDLAAGNVLTDEPYYDTDPVPVDDGQFFVADLVGGRLVENPAQIAAQLDQYVTSSGQLARSTAFTAGYDFTKDGAATVADRSDRGARRAERPAADLRHLDGHGAARQPGPLPHDRRVELQPPERPLRPHADADRERECPGHARDGRRRRSSAP